MPLRSPKSKEEREDFVSRCVDTITKGDRYKWSSEKQQAAICYSRWDEY